MGVEPPEVLVSIAEQVDPHARLRAAAPQGDERLAWEIEIDENAEPVEEPAELKLARMSTGMRFKFQPRRLLRQ